MNNDFARPEVLRHKWLTAEGKPKEYDEILNVAEEARKIQMGMRAAVTMTVTGGHDFWLFPLKGWNNLVHVKGFRNASKWSLRGQQEQRRTTTRKRGIECWNCHKIHWGGYRNCRQRARENPQWELQQRQTRHNAGPTTTTAVLQVSGYTSGKHTQFGIRRKRLPKSQLLFLSRECWMRRT